MSPRPKLILCVATAQKIINNLPAIQLTYSQASLVYTDFIAIYLLYPENVISQKRSHSIIEKYN